MERDDIYYQHSGKMTSTGVAVSVMAAFVTAAIMGLLGAISMLIGTYFIDVGFLGIVLTAGIVGMLQGKAIKIGKIRNDRYAYWSGVVTGILGLLVTSLIFYIFLQMNDLDPSLGLDNGVYYPWENPGRMFILVDAYVTDEGKRASSALLVYAAAYLTKIFYITAEFPHLSGPWLYGLWVIEAVILVFWTGSRCRVSAGTQDYVFCEQCNHEARVLYKTPLLEPLPIARSEPMQRLKAELEKGHFSALQALPVAAATIQPGEFARLIIRGCDSCNNFYCVDVVNVTVKRDDDELMQLADNDNRIVEHLMVPADVVSDLQAHFEKAQLLPNH